MRNFLAGIVATVLAGFLLFLLEQAYSASTKSQQLALEYSEYRPSFSIAKGQPDAWFKSRDGKDSSFYDSVNIEIVKIKNTGNAPVRNQLVRVLPKGDELLEPSIKGFGTIYYPGDDKNSVQSKIDNGELILKYDLLDRGDEHMFWIAYDKSAEPNFIIRGGDLKVTGWTRGMDASSQDSDTTFWWFGGGIALFTAFLIGLIVQYSNLKSQLKKRGIDLAKVLADANRGTAPAEDRVDA